MTTNTLRPNASLTNSGTLVGAASVAIASSDDSDASYVEMVQIDSFSNEAFSAGLGTFTIPAGNLVRSVTIRVRGHLESGSVGSSNNSVRVSGGGSSLASVSRSSTTLGESSSGPQPVTLTQAQVTALEVTSAASFNGTKWWRCMELYVDVVHAVQPVATITYPTGTPTITGTNKPTITWTHTAGSDGGAQAWYQVKVFDDATYGGGGFDPDTSTPDYDSGEVTSSATSQQTASLDNTDTYRAYVRTAQSINGAKHWSAWDIEEFTISVTTTDVDTVVLTPDDANARILVTVTRDGASAAWDLVEIESSIDTGTTWLPVRFADYVDATGNANTFTVYDYETPNSVDTLYRARATRIVSELPISGAWVSSTADQWTSTSEWLKDPLDSTLNMVIVTRDLAPEVRNVRQGVNYVLGATAPVVVSDVLSDPAGVLTLRTDNETQLAALLALLRSVLLLYQPCATFLNGPAQNASQYIAISSVTEARPIPTATPFRFWTIPYTQIDPPAVTEG